MYNSTFPLQYLEGYEDERAKHPMKLVRKYGTWTIVLEEHRDSNGNGTGMVTFRIMKNSTQAGMHDPFVEGRAPNLETAARLIEHALVDYAIKIPVTPSSESEEKGRDLLERPSL